ncbi:hypothetical protein MHA_0351 [Mannheimia haemolytica PHL213]|nr:hypothetical protein MHA_0351 [Mannheimia haemolytica PHL213]
MFFNNQGIRKNKAQYIGDMLYFIHSLQNVSE